MKKHITILMALSMILMSAIAFASNEHEGGRQVWKKGCRIACHDGKTPGSPVLSPDSKTQLQWKNNFANDKEYIRKFHQAGELKRFTQKQWDAIYEFVFNHAHDSDNPEDCMGSDGELIQ